MGCSSSSCSPAVPEYGLASLLPSELSPMQKYLKLRELRAHQQDRYYQLVLNYTQEILPYIYTPTVGEACQQYHVLPGLTTRGLYISLLDRGSILKKLQAWPAQGIRVAVATDGERILGLGDLGANGMGISEGKIELYTAAAGVNPSACLPICLDVGTNNVKLREHPSYKGLRQPRPPVTEYDGFIEEFMSALKAWQPHLLLQFEDFGNQNAFRLLDTYRPQACCFNDDIQGTACITLAGLLSGLRLVGGNMSEQRVLFMGAGEAAAGIATLITNYIHTREGVPLTVARRCCHLIDSKGLVCAERTDLQDHKLPFAHDTPFEPDLPSAVQALQPTVLIGVSAVRGAFDESVLQAMAAINERPIILPLSNPTSLSECTYEEAFRGTEGRVVFASGSPFDPITTPEGTTYYPAQSNNAYIFPAVGYAAVLSGASTIDDECFMLAAEVLAGLSTPEEASAGLLFPPFSNIRDVSSRIIAAVAQHMVLSGAGQKPEGWPPLDAPVEEWEQAARQAMWSPE